MFSILKKPSAWIPIGLSLAMLAFMVIWVMFVSSSPPNPNTDEGVGAHLFQIWLALEFFMILFFGIKWIPQKPKPALEILVLQIIAMLFPMSIVHFLHL